MRNQIVAKSFESIDFPTLSPPLDLDDVAAFIDRELYIYKIVIKFDLLIKMFVALSMKHYLLHLQHALIAGAMAMLVHIHFRLKNLARLDVFLKRRVNITFKNDKEKRTNLLKNK